MDAPEEDFFDVHFDIPTIIKKNVVATADLTFTPPEYYDVHADMLAQREHLHGLENRIIDERGIEVRSENSVINAGRIISHAAREVRLRDHVMNGLISEKGLGVDDLTVDEIPLHKDPVIEVVDDAHLLEDPLCITTKYKTRLKEGIGRGDDKSQDLITKIS